MEIQISHILHMYLNKMATKVHYLYIKFYLLGSNGDNEITSYSVVHEKAQKN